VGKLCDHNIGQSARNLRFGGSTLLVGLGLAWTLFVVEANLPRPLLVLAFGPFTGACLMFYQAAYRTCVYRAFHRQRVTELGVEPVANPEQVQRDLRRARSVVGVSIASAAALTGLLFLIP
jgi:hypothetical protein